ncbi:MAG TPA: flagellar motor stator protein MotA [Hyphomicrobiaceae bacterium]|nr:flagellar motor stator protein MotA [Hyphomicrobiaceae bacterium]
MTIPLGLVVTLACMLGGFAAMGGKLGVIWQPWEYVIILGASVGTFIVANPMKTIKDSGVGCLEALKNAVPKKEDYLVVLTCLFSLIRELKSKSRAEVEKHIDNPTESAIFTAYPRVLNDEKMLTFICDYFRLILMGNARTHEIEALMDEEISTMRADKLKCYHSLVAMSEGLPALGIVAAVLGVIKAMSALDQPPEVLGHYIGAALVGTFAGIFFSYAVVTPIATQVKIVREKQMRQYIVIKQTLLALMNGAMPQIAVEHGRKAISAADRPSVDELENATLNPGSVGAAGGAEKKAA